MNAQIEMQDLDAILQTAIDAGVAFDAVLTPEERQLLETYQHRDRKIDFIPHVALTEAQLEQAEYDFAALTVAEALTALADKIHAVMSRRREELYWKCIEAYYVAEELSRDPEHAHLIPHVEAMRAAHERDYGKPIPPRGGH
jgi:hypothetical protein